MSNPGNLQQQPPAQPDNVPTHQDNLEYLHHLVGGGELAEQLDNFTPQKVVLLRSESFQEILEMAADWAQELFNCSEQELTILSNYNIHMALGERAESIAELIQNYGENPKHLRYLTCDSIDDEVVDDVLHGEIDQLTLYYLDQYGDQGYVIETLGENDAVPLLQALGHFGDAEEDDNEEQYLSAEDDNNEEQYLAQAPQPPQIPLGQHPNIFLAPTSPPNPATQHINPPASNFQPNP
jgi:hypothetical protein